MVSLVARALPVSSPSARCREARDAEISSHVLMSSEVDFVRVAVGVVSLALYELTSPPGLDTESERDETDDPPAEVSDPVGDFARRFSSSAVEAH